VSRREAARLEVDEIARRAAAFEADRDGNGAVDGEDEPLAGLLWHCCHSVVALLSLYCGTAITLLWHCLHSVVALLSLFFTLLSHCSRSALTQPQD
jgi:hypothetical protein